MVTSYTNVAKPSGTTYTPATSTGRETYDDSTISYDDSTVNYDGNQASYTQIQKPSATTYTNIAKPS